MKDPFRSGGTKQRLWRCWILHLPAQYDVEKTAQYDDKDDTQAKGEFQTMSNTVIDKKAVKEIGLEFFRLRREKSLFIYQVAKRTSMPEKVIEGIELGRYVKYGKIRRLAEFYGKRTRIVFEN